MKVNRHEVGEEVGAYRVKFIAERDGDDMFYTVIVFHNGVDMTLYDGDNGFIANDTYHEAIKFFEAKPEEVPSGY